VLDLAGVSLCDSVGLNVLLGAWRQADAGGAVRVFNTVADAEAVFSGCRCAG
jgi:anti-anti-sigma regulatory factor